MSFVSIQSKLMVDQQRDARKRAAKLRATNTPKRNYTNFSGNYGPGDEAFRKYLKSLEKWKNMNTW